MKKRLLAAMLALCLVAGSAPLEAFAAQKNTTSVENTVTDSEREKREEEAKELFGEESSTTKPDGVQHAEDNPADVKASETLHPDKKILLIQDNLPWDSSANTTVLSKIAPYEKVKSSQVGGMDLSGYDMIVFANDQAFSTYTSYASIRDNLEAYVTAGGVLILGACDSGWASGKLVEDLPGGVTKHNRYSYYNYIVDKSHPIVTRILSEGTPLVNGDLYNNYCSHVAFNTASLPEGTNIILEDTAGQPTLVEYQMGKGTVIASGLTWEHNYVYGGSNGRGTYSKKAFDDLFLYGLSLSGADRLLTPSISYSIDADKVGVFVGDKEDRTGLAGAVVTLNGKSVTADEYGVAQIDLQAGTYYVTVEAEGYHKRTLNLFLEKGTMEPVYMTSSSVTEPYIEVANVTNPNTTDTKDVLKSRMYFTDDDETTVSYDFTSELAGKTFSKYRLYQGTNILELKTHKGSFKPGTTFDAESPIYLQLVCTDGTTSKAYKTNIFIKEASSGFIGHKEESGNFSFGRGVGFKIPGDMPIIGGTEFKIGVGDMPVAIEYDNNRVKIAIGFTDFKNDEDAWNDFKEDVDKACQTAERLDSLKELCDTYGAKAGGFDLDKGWDDKPEFKVAGYVEGTWDSETNKITSISGMLMGGAEYMYHHNQQFIVGPVPVYFEIGAGAEIEISATVTKILLDTEEIQLNIPLTLTPKFTIGGGAGINGALSVGAEGEVTLPITWNMTQKYLKVNLTGGMKLTASLLFVFTAEKSIAEGTWVIYEGSYSDGGVVNAVADVQKFNISNYDEYKVINRDYRTKTSAWGSGSKARAAQTSYTSILQSYSLPGTKPQMASANGTTVMVFQADNGANDATEAVTLMYSVLTANGWTEPEIVWEDNVAADYYAELKADENDIYLVWQKAKDVAAEAEALEQEQEAVEELEAEETEEVAAAVELEEIEFEEEEVEEPVSTELDEETEIVSFAQTMEIAFAKFDSSTNTFAQQTYVTENAYYDGSAVLAKNPDGTISVIWVENESGDILTAGTSNKIKHSVISNGAVTSTETLHTTTDYILTMSAEYVGNALKVAYSADTDGDLNTTEDVEICLYSGGSVSEITNDDVLNVNPQIVGSTLYWSENSSIVGYDLSAGTSRAVGTGSANFKVIETTRGTEVVYIVDNESLEDIQTYTIAENVEDNKVLRIGKTPGNIDSFEVYVDDDGAYHMIMGMTDADDDDNFMLVYHKASEFNDLVLSSVKTTDRDYKDGVQTATLYVRNEGLTDAEGFEVTVYENGTRRGVIEVEDTIPAGEERAIEITFKRNYPNKVYTYEFCITNDADYYTDNNTAEVELGYTDAALDVKEYHLGNEIELLAQISNLTGRKSDVVFEIYEDSLDGEVIFSRTFEDVDNANSQIVSFTLDRSKMNVTPGKDKTYIVTISAENEVITSNNQYVLLIPTLASEVTSVEIEDGDKTRVFDYDTYKGKTFTLTAKTFPENVAANVTWESSNTNVATVSASGVVTIKGTGKASITAKVDDDTTDSLDIQVLKVDKTAPTGMTVTSKSAAGVSLKWNALKSISNYEVYRSTSEKSGYTLLGRTSNTTYTDGEVEVGKTYYYKVRGYINSNGEYIYTKYSGVVSAKITLAVPKVTASVSGTGVAYVDWDSIDGATSYEVHRATSKTGTYKLLTTTSSSYYYDRSVTLGKTYYYKVLAKKGNAKSGLSSAAKVKITVAPPSYVSIYNEGYNKIRAYISSVSGANGYELYRATSEKGKYTKVATSEDYYIVDEGLTLDKTYYYKARAYAVVNGKTHYSPYTSVTTVTKTLATPYWNEAVAAGDSQIYLEWNPVDGATGYEVYTCDTYYGTYKKIKSVKTTNFLHKKLAKDSLHYYKIRAYRKEGSKTYYSSESSYYSARTGFARPYNVEVTYNGKNNVIKFGKPQGASGVEISASTSYYGTYEVLTNTTKTSYTHKNVTPVQYYYYKLRSYKTVNGVKEYSSYYYASVYTSAPEMKNLKVTNRSGKSLKLSWDKISWVDGYEVYRRDGSNGSFVKVATINKAKTTSYIDKKLLPTKTYTYMVRAFVELGGYVRYGYYSDYEYANPKVPTPVVTTTNGYKGITLKWKKVTDANGYIIYRSTSKNGTYSKIKTITKGSTLSYKDTKVTHGKSYYYKVRAYTKCDGTNYYSNYTSPLATKAAVATPTVTSNITGVGKVKLTWKKVSGASGYEIYRSTSKTKGFKKVKTISKGSAVSYTNSSLTTGQTYYYKIRAYRKSGVKKIYGDYSVVEAIKVTPPQVTISKVTAGKGQVTLKWKSISGVSGYEVYRSTSKNGKYTKVTTVTGASKASYIDKKLTSKKTYYYKVRAYKTVKGKKVYGSYSSIKSSKTK